MNTHPAVKNNDQCFFRKPYSGSRKFERAPFSPLAFVDLALLIILFFITVHFSEMVVRPGIKLDLPSAPFRSGTHFDRFNIILITLSREGMVFFNDELTTLEGLETAISRARHKSRDINMVIQADSSIDYGTIIRIFNIGAAAGIEEITLATSIAREAAFEQ